MNRVLFAINCPVCGGPVSDWDPYMGIGKCSYCDSLVKEQAEDDEGKGRLLSRISGYLKLGEHENAKIAIHQFQIEYPGDFRGWYGEYTLQIDRSHADNNSILSMGKFPRCSRALKNMIVCCEYDWEKDFVKAELASLADDEQRVAELVKSADEVLTPLLEKAEACRDKFDQAQTCARGPDRDNLTKLLVDGMIAGMISTHVAMFVFGIFTSGNMGPTIVQQALYCILVPPIFGTLPGAIVGLLGAGVVDEVRARKIRRLRRETTKLKKDLAAVSDEMSEFLSTLSENTGIDCRSARNMLERLSKEKKELSEAVADGMEIAVESGLYS